uniref:Uncharacterized protein n=1 Tax=Romanomermis culicivorax TaxID=13658 RepID=A0A915J885_ROMCU
MNYRRVKPENVGATWQKSVGKDFENTNQTENSYTMNSKSQKIDPLHDAKTPNADLTLEVAVFVDHLLWQRFEKKFARDSGTHLRRFVFTVVQNAQLIYKYNMFEPTMDFNLVHYDVLTKPS